MAPYSIFEKGGNNGLVPTPESSATASQYLNAEGTWTIPPNTTYSNMVGATASAAGKAGLVPAPSVGITSKYLRSDGTWATPPNTTYSDMIGASTSADGAHGLVPKPTKGTANRYLRSDGTWSIPPDNNTEYSNFTGAKNGYAGASGLVPAPGVNTEDSYFLKANGTWAVPPDTTYNDFTGATTNAKGVHGLVPAPTQNTTLSYLKSTGNWDSVLTALDTTDNDNKLVTNKGIRDGITNATNGLVNNVTQDSKTPNSFKVSFKSGSDKTITINNVTHATSADLATTATSADKATKLTNARKIGAVSFNGEKDITFKDIGFVEYKHYYGINWDGTEDGAAEDWYLRPPQSSKNTPTSKDSGFLPLIEGSLGNGHSSLGKSDWYFKNSYVDNSYVNQVNFDNGSASIQYDATNKCINFVFA